MDEIAIRVDHVSKDFVLPHQRSNSVKSVFTGLFSKKGKAEKQHALKDISLEIKKGEFFGIVGRNGSGKSTLLKILASIYQPTKGTIQVNGKLVPFIELGVGFNPELTGRENVYLNGAMLGFSQKEVEAMYNDIVEFAELERFMDQKLKNYSSGMQVRLAFSMATRSKADILLIDEVLAVGDADFQRKCYEYFKSLKKNKVTVVFVSHDMNAVREFCDRAVLIDKSELKKEGKPNDVAKEYSLLFMDNEGPTSNARAERWGNGLAKYHNVKVSIDGEDVVVEADITAESESTVSEKFACGVHIQSSDGKDIVATNNRLINYKDLTGLGKGDKTHVTWKILNVFSDGKYNVTLTLVNGGDEVFDWLDEAATFTVKRPERSVTPILPPISVAYGESND